MRIETARTYYIYILTNQARNAFETGVTGNLVEKLGNGEPRDGNEKVCHHLVHFEGFDEPLPAIKREEQIRNYSRKRKAELIDQSNPEWRFLNDDIKSSDHLAKII
jgi:putative endonuclease